MTDEERAILKRLAAGEAASEIAPYQPGWASRALVDALLDRLGARTPAHAVAIALREGLIK